MNLIVSTCGTSVLTKLAAPDLRELVTTHANASADNEVPFDDRKKIADLVDIARTKLLDANLHAAKDASAELNGILSLAGDRVPLSRADVYVLLHTDTWLGVQAASLVQQKLQQYGVTAQLERVPSLSTRSRESFDDGLRNLVDWAANTLPGYRDKKYRVVFNLVGGFKAVQGFMQTLGMFYADEIVYIFEKSAELLRIPKLPVDLNAAARNVMTDHAADFRRLDILDPQSCDSINIRDIPETLLYCLDADVELSPWGKLLWNSFKPELYRQRLLPSPSPRIRYTDPFGKDAQSLTQDRIAVLNHRIDDLLRYLHHASVKSANLRRLDVKQLHGNPKPPSTHEADAWADADCRRIFFHYESNAIVLNRLDKALH